MTNFRKYENKLSAPSESRVNTGNVSPTAWMGEAICRDLDPNVFYPADGVGVVHAQSICANCGVKEECLEYALTEGIDHGIWGGTSERERRRILKRRRQNPS